MSRSRLLFLPANLSHYKVKRSVLFMGLLRLERFVGNPGGDRTKSRAILAIGVYFVRLDRST